MNRVAPLGLIATLVFAQSVSAQMSAGARSVGMGGGGMVFASGVDAAEWNPANLASNDGWNVSVFEFGAVGIGEGATVDEILTIFGADFGGAADLNVAQVVAGLPADGIRLSFVTEGYTTAKATGAASVPSPGSPLPSIGVAYGQFALRIRSRVFTNLSMSRELADLIGNGFSEENLLSYAVGNTGWRTTSMSEVTVSYGLDVGRLALGFGGRYVAGHGMVNGRFFEPRIDPSRVGFNPPAGCVPLTVTAVAVESTDGKGFGLDVGLSVELLAGLRASASGTNVVQNMTWNDALVAHTAMYTDEDFDFSGGGSVDLEVEDFLNRFEGEPLDPNGVSLPVFAAAQGLFEESYFPQIFRAGVGWQSGGTTLDMTGVKVSPRGRFASPWDERLSLGVEQEVPVLTLRAGYAFAQDGITALTGGIGIGIGPVDLEASGGRFGGTNTALASPWDGYYFSMALQVTGGGL